MVNVYDVPFAPPTMALALANPVVLAMITPWSLSYQLYMEHKPHLDAVAHLMIDIGVQSTLNLIDYNQKLIGDHV